MLDFIENPYKIYDEKLYIFDHAIVASCHVQTPIYASLYEMCKTVNAECTDEEECFSLNPRPLKQPPILQIRTIVHFDPPALVLAMFLFLQS